MNSVPFTMYVIDASNYAVLWASSTFDSSAGENGLYCYRYLHNRKVSCEKADYVCPINVIKRTKGPTSTQHVHYDEMGNSMLCAVDAYPIFNDNKKVVQIVETAIENQGSEIDLLKQRLGIKD